MILSRMDVKKGRYMISDLPKVIPHEIVRVSVYSGHAVEEYRHSYSFTLYSVVAAKKFVQTIIDIVEDLDDLNFDFEDWCRCEFDSEDEWIDFLSVQGTFYYYGEVSDYDFVRKMFPDKFFEYHKHNPFCKLEEKKDDI